MNASSDLPDRRANEAAHLVFEEAFRLHQEGRIEAAKRGYRQALKLNPGHADALRLLALAGRAFGDRSENRSLLQKSININPRHPDAYLQLGNLELDDGNLEKAAACFRQTLQLAPGVPVASAALQEAEKRLQCRQEIQQRHSSSSINIGVEYFHNKEPQAAIMCLQAAIETIPQSPQLYETLAKILQESGRMIEAQEVYKKATSLNPDNLQLGLYHLFLNMRLGLCDPQAEQRLLNRLISTTNARQPQMPEQFPCIMFCESAKALRSVAELYVHSAIGKPSFSGKMPEARFIGPDDKLRVGYFSGDFYQHPMSHLIAEVLELHDRNSFDIFLLSTSPGDGSSLRRRIENNGNFIDLAERSDDEMARDIRQLSLDILVDLKAFTGADSKCALLANRLAPIQVHWAGYPGTSGAYFIDYLIADPFVIPPGSEQFYSEQIARLPHCYLPTDRTRPVAPPFPRQDYGLREDAIVLCSFNQVAKIRPDIFQIWIDVLDAVVDSVLWLLDVNQNIIANLCSTVDMRGVSSERIVNAPRFSPCEHLARCSVADLAVDTYPCNSHTTATDVLWAGTPLVTLCGETFPSRVAASQLNALGMPELVTYNRADYKAKILELANDRQQLSALRHKLSRQIKNTPMFDTPRLTRNLEGLFRQIQQRSANGQPPGVINCEDVSPL